MPERPRPDIDHTREALREHDERAEEPAGPDEREAPGSDEEDEDEAE